MEEKEERKIMSFKDEDGNKVDFELVAKIYINNKEYMILSPADKPDSEDVFAFRVDTVGENIEYNLVEDNNEFQEVKKEYKNLLY